MKETSENRKALPKFLGIMVLALLLGAVIGVLILFAEGDWSSRLTDAIQHGLAAVAPWLIWVCALVMAVISIAFYAHSKRLLQSWQEDDTEGLAKIEKGLSIALICVSVLLILAFFFLSAQIAYIEWISMWPFFLGLGGFMIVLVITVVSQQKIVDLEKKLNPEKRGSVYDTKFAKKWYESCDEAEQAMICQAAYTAYSAGNLACMILWLLLVIGNMLFHFGLLPIAVTTILWLVLTLSYSIKAAQLEHGAAQRK